VGIYWPILVPAYVYQHRVAGECGACHGIDGCGQFTPNDCSSMEGAVATVMAQIVVNVFVK